MQLSGFHKYEDLKEAHFKWIASAVKSRHHEKDQKWSRSVGVGSKQFVENMRHGLRGRVKGRKFLKTAADSFQLRETRAPFGVNTSNGPEVASFFSKIGTLRHHMDLICVIGTSKG